MTRRLLLLRHGKSNWGVEYGQDHDRPLAPRGRRSAEAVGKFLVATNRVPDSIITSSAVRARATVEVAAAAGPWECPVRVTRNLYGAGSPQVLDEIGKTDGAVRTLLIAGHEPTWSDLAGRLIGGARIRMPTAAVACIRFDTATWDRIDDGRGVLEWLVTPKRLLDFFA